MDSLCFSLRNPWVVDLVNSIFTFGNGNLTMFIITCLILGYSTYVFLSHSRHNLQVLDLEQEFDLINSDQEDSNPMLNVVNKGCLNVGSLDSCSENEVIGRFSCTTVQDYEVDGWRLSSESCQITDGSDGSISDEESLIEIELPGGHYVGYKEYKGEEEPKFRRQMSSDSVLWWPEMYEEDNMIEIDISMGSIKCSRFEVKA